MGNIIRNDRLKVLSILSTLYIIAILSIIVKVQVADGYEVSLYQTYPVYFWLLIIGCYLVGIFYCVYILFNTVYHNKYFLLIPIFTILFTLILITLLPFIRGYAIFGREDILSHVGLMKDILKTGQFGDNWYPVLHIFGSQFSMITTIDTQVVSMVFPTIFYLFYILGILFMGRELFGKKIGFIIFLISLIPLFGTYTITFAPHTLGLFLLPFMTYLFLKSIKEVRYSFLYVLSMLPFVLFHPLRGLFFIAIITIILFIVRLYHNPYENKGRKFSNSSLRKESYARSNLKWQQWLGFIKNMRKQRFFSFRGGSLNRVFTFKKSSNWLRLILLSSIIWTAWYILYEPYHRALWLLKGFIVQFFESNYQVYGDIVQDFSPPLSYVLKIGIFRLGVFGIMTLLALFFIIFQKKGFRNIFKNKMEINLMIYLSLLFIVITVLFFLIGSPGGYGRYLPYAIFFSTFLVGLLFYTINKDSKSIINKYHINKFIYFLFAIMIVLSIFSLYDSPLQGTDNRQVTRMELTGMKWTFETRNDSILIEEIMGLNQRRFFHAIYGLSENDTGIRKYDKTINPHFGYDNNDTLGSQYGSNVYLVISEINRVRYQEIYPDWEEAQFFKEDDFKKLEYDMTVNKIYNNEEFAAYYIKSGDML